MSAILSPQRVSVWPTVAIGDVCLVNPGKPKVDMLAKDAPVSFVPMASVSEVSGSIVSAEIREYAKVRGSYTAFQEGDVLFAKITPCMENGKAAIARNLVNGLGFGSSEFHILRPTNKVLPEFIYQLIRQKSFRADARDNMTGSVGQARVPTEWLRNFEFELPPIETQREIVGLISQLQEQMESTSDRLATIPALLKKFRQSVLSAAYDGSVLEDTEGLILAPKILRDVIDRIEAGMSFRAEGFPPRDGEPGVIKVSAMTWGKFDPRESKKLLPGTNPNPRTEIKPGDLLFSRANTEELVGATVLVKSTPANLYLSDKSLRLVASPGVSRAWLNIVLSAPQVREYFADNATGTSNSMRNISQSKLLITPLLVPNSEVQEQIAKRVESLFALADSIETRLDKATAQVERTTQAILAKAFRGELTGESNVL